MTAGAGEALLAAFIGLLDLCDEVIVPDPGFVSYAPAILIAQGRPIGMPLLEKNSFVPSIQDVTSLITRKSRVMLLNSQSNPTGSMLSYVGAASLAKVAVERDISVISDEVYEKIVYDDNKHVCMAALPEMRARTLVVGSFSKT